MDFESILEQWESDYTGHGLSGKKNPLPETNQQNWVDAFPPNTEALKEKDAEKPPRVSNGRSVWLKKDAQEVLDLHGLTSEEARESIIFFIRSMHSRHLVKGLIIHGKGLHSTDGSILKPLVRKILETSKEVGEFGRASRKDGGSGASWFILRQRSR